MIIDAAIAGWIGLASLAMFVGSLLVLPWLLARIPADYFVRSPQQPRVWKHPILRWIWHLMKNVLGLILILAGVIMLFTPGQGVLTLLAGLWLIDLPGKRALELQIIRRPKILSAVNRLRQRAHHPPLELPPDHAA